MVILIKTCRGKIVPAVFFLFNQFIYFLETFSLFPLLWVSSCSSLRIHSPVQCPPLTGVPGSTSSLSIHPLPGTHRASPEISQGEGADWEPTEGRVFKSLQCQINSATAEVQTKTSRRGWVLEPSGCCCSVFPFPVDDSSPWLDPDQGCILQSPRAWTITAQRCRDEKNVPNAT